MLQFGRVPGNAETVTIAGGALADLLLQFGRVPGNAETMQARAKAPHSAGFNLAAFLGTRKPG